MQYARKYLTALVVPLALVLCTTAEAEVRHEQINSLNKITYVTDDAWQPENFDNGTVIPATYVIEAGITLDGRDDEPQWAKAQEVTVPLFYGNIKEVSLKALYTEEDVFIRVRWPDEKADREYHPWVWDAEQERYIAGPQLEDSVLLSFEAGCEWTPSLLSGYIYDFDAWQWLAARSDPTGKALDLYGSMKNREIKSRKVTKYDSRNKEDIWNLKFIDKNENKLHAEWNELDRAYMYQPVTTTVYYRGEPDWDGSSKFVEQLAAPETPPEDVTQTFPQFSPLPLEGGSAEVSAKGHWEDGYWTVEFSRKRVTPSKEIYDTVFNRLTQFSVHVFDQAEAIDQSSESHRLFLNFLPEKAVLVQD